MKKFFLNMIGVVLAGVGFTACSPDDFSGADANGIPEIANYEAKVAVDQEANVATFELVDLNGNPAKGVYPIWTINAGKEIHSTVNGYKTEKIVVAGDYTYTYQVANKNGIGDGTKDGKFTINTTRYDFSPKMKLLTGDGSKEWRVYSIKKGHLGCGPNHDEPAGWWAAGPDEKASEGMYDDRITFTADGVVGGKFTYNAGEDGNTFLNSGVTIFDGNPGADWSWPCVGKAGAQTETNFSLTYNADRDEIGFTLPAKTLFPYIANDAQFNGAMTYWVTSLDDKTMTIVLDFDGISWQMILVNGDDEAVEEEFDPENVNWADVNSDLNLAKAANTIGEMTFWWADASWSQTADPGFAYADGVYTITCAPTGGGEWQGQSSIHNVATDMKVGEFYDYSFVIEAEQSNSLALTFKVAEEGNDSENAAFYVPGIKVKKGKNVIRFAKKQFEKASDFKNAVIFFDLGAGSQPGEVYKISDIIVQKHNPK